MSATGQNSATEPMDAVEHEDRPLVVTVYANKTASTPIRTGTKRWSTLLPQLRVRDVREPKDGLAFSMVSLQPGTTRGSKNVAMVSGLVFDIDGTALDEIRDKVTKYEHFAYSTHSHTPEDPHYRLIFPLTRDVTPAEFRELWKHVNASLLGGVADKQCCDVGRLYFSPSCPAGAHSHAFAIQRGGMA